MSTRGQTAAGLACAIGACMFWGWSYIVPAILAEYDPVLVACARYAALGVLCLPIAAVQRKRLAALRWTDWLTAAELSTVGNIGFFAFLSVCVQLAGSPMAGVLTSLMPVLAALAANLLDRRAHVPWRRILPPLALLAAGIALARASEMSWMTSVGARTPRDFSIGVAFGVLAALTWVWYPIRNTFWLRDRPHIEPFAWTTAQGLTTLPLSAAIYLWRWQTACPTAPILGERAALFLAVAFALAFFGSWIGFALWSRASLLLPSAICCQTIVFEPLFALSYAYAMRGQMPPATMMVAIAAVIAGVSFGVRAFQRRTPANTSPP